MLGRQAIREMTNSHPLGQERDWTSFKLSLVLQLPCYHLITILAHPLINLTTSHCMKHCRSAACYHLIDTNQPHYLTVQIVHPHVHHSLILGDKYVGNGVDILTTSRFIQQWDNCLCLMKCIDGVFTWHSCVMATTCMWQLQAIN